MPSQGMFALANFTVASAQATVTFSNIPATYRDLRLVVSGGMTVASSLTMQINGDTTGKYNRVNVGGNGASALSTNTASATSIALNGFSTSGDNSIIDFLDYAVTDKQKIGQYRSNSQVYNVEGGHWRYASTAAITSFAVSSGSSTFIAGTTFTLFGIVG